ncbi:MAG TPA: DinB family protein, partial [Blastocatellia bacterium]|nr:DinB family protein [Blastocatellia bacterium]
PASWEGIPSETLTVIEQICHVRDIEIEGYQVRFRRLLEESNPALVSIDTYALVSQYRYAEADPTEVLRKIRGARHQTVELIGNLTESQLNRTGFFDGYGKVTVKGLIHYLCSHDQQHLAGMQWLLGQIESQSAS